MKSDKENREENKKMAEGSAENEKNVREYKESVEGSSKKEKENTKKEEDNKEIEAVKSKLTECQKLNDEYLNGWKRAKADFLNYKKEEDGRIKRFLDYNNEEFILDLLPILDNFYIATNKMPRELTDNQWVKGILKIKEQLTDFLTSRGVEEIKSQIGKEFNPNFHEVVEEVKKDGVESGAIVEEIRKGYILNGKVIRSAKVKVAK